MARNHRTPNELEAIAKQLFASATVLNDVAAAMRSAEMPDALVHSTMPENTHIPAIEDWVGKLNVDVRSQLRSFLTGVQSRAELLKQQSTAQRAAAAKKPLPSKAAKKKST